MTITIETLSTIRKALAINLEPKFYGTFAEIGAGQEVARHFFQAGKASATIAKTMSAYDKTFSDSIYGEGNRFVSEARLGSMLEHEYTLLEDRLADQKSEKAFFAFANTVATSSHDANSHCHGWMGVKFQIHPCGPINEIKLHIRMLDQLRLQQQEALGILGVNLLYAALYKSSKPEELVSTFLEGLSSDRREINFVGLNGDDLIHLDSRLVSLEIVKQGLTKAALFNPDGETISPADEFYKKPVFAFRGTFRPITNTNLTIMDAGLRHMKKIMAPKEGEPLVLLEISMSQLLTDSGHINQKDFLDRVDTLCAMGHHVLVSNYPLFSQLKAYLRRHTEATIGMVIGANLLEKILNTKLYGGASGALHSFADLFDEKTHVFVFPFKTDGVCLTAKSFTPKDGLSHLFHYFLDNNFIVDLLDCEELDASTLSERVRVMLSEGDSDWEKHVPPEVCELIKKRKLFGYSGK